MDKATIYRFSDFLDVVSQSIWVLDPEGRIIQANRSACLLMGLASREVEGLPLWQIPWQSLNQKARKSIERAVHAAVEGKSVQLEFKARANSKKARAFDFQVRPFLDQGQVLSFIIVEGRDITAFHEANEALFTSEARFQAIYEAAGIGILIKGRNGKMLDCNPAFERMVGFSPNELRRRDYLEITHPSDRRASRKLFSELVSGKRTNYTLEKRYVHQNGQFVWASMKASVVYDLAGNLKFVVAMVEDITSNRLMEEELSEVKHHLMDNIEKERLRLAQDLHDGPLQEIIGVSFQISDIEKKQRDGDSREQLRSIRESLQKLIQSVRTISSELRPPALVPFGLEKTILSHIEAWKSAHPEINVSTRLAHDGLLLPENVRIALYRVYQEALANILRHSGAKSVSIKFRLTRVKAILVIEDDGIGFDLPSQWVILVRQGHLGLVGAMERVQNIGGNLEVMTSPGHGTHIQVTVPVPHDPPASAGKKEDLP